MRIHVPKESLRVKTRTSVRESKLGHDQHKSFHRSFEKVHQTLESIQHTIFHSVPLPSFFGTSIPRGALSKTSGVRGVPRSRSCASVSKGISKDGSKIREMMSRDNHF